MSKASTAAPGFGVATPVASRTYVKENTQTSHERPLDRGDGEPAKNKATAPSQKLLLSDMIYDRLANEQRRRKRAAPAQTSYGQRLASPIQRESREDLSLWQELRASGN